MDSYFRLLKVVKKGSITSILFGQFLKRYAEIYADPNPTVKRNTIHKTTLYLPRDSTKKIVYDKFQEVLATFDETTDIHYVYFIKVWKKNEVPKNI